MPQRVALRLDVLSGGPHSSLRAAFETAIKQARTSSGRGAADAALEQHGRLTETRHALIEHHIDGVLKPAKARLLAPIGAS